MRIQLLLLVLKLCILHGSAGSTISPSPATFSAVPSIEGVPGPSANSTQSAPPLPDGLVSHSPIVSPPYKSAPVPQPIDVLVPSMPSSPPAVVPTRKSAPSNQTVPELVPPTPQSVSQKVAPDIQPPSAVPDIQVPVASPPIKVPEIPQEHPSEPGVAPTVSASPNHTVPVASPPVKVSEIPPPVHPSEPGVAPTVSASPNHTVSVASPPVKVSEIPPPMHPSEPGVAPIVSDVVPPISVPPPGTRKEFGIPVAAPPKETSNKWSPTNHHQAKGNALSPIASPPKMISDKPVAVHPSKPGAAPSTSSERTASPISSPPPSTSRKDYAIPVAAPPKGTIDQLTPVSHPPIKEPSVSPKSTPPRSSRKEYGIPMAPPPRDKSHQLSPSNQSPKKEHGISPKSTPAPSMNKKGYGMPVAAPPKHTFDKLSPMTHSPTNGLFPIVAPSPPKVIKPSQIVPAPSIISPKHKKMKWAPSPASVPSVSSYKHQHARKNVITPALAPSYSDVPPSSNHRDPVVPATPHPPTEAPKTSPFIPLAPLHPPIVAPKKSRLRRHYPPPFSHGSVSPIQPPVPSTITQDAPAPSPSPTFSWTKSPLLRPLKSPSASPPKNPNAVPPPPVQVLPPPPPNQDCTSLACSEPLTNSPPGAPCGCVSPIKVGLRLGVALYTFFPLVSELAQEIASGVFMKQSQVRIMGANAATQQLEKTDVIIDLVPLGEKFDNTTAFLTYEKFWHKQVIIKTNFFGAYDVLYVNYPGLPPSPPSAASSIIIDGIPYNNPGNNARTVHPLGVDVRKRHKGGLSSSIIAIIVLSSFAALVLCVGAAWVLLLKCGDQTHLVAKTPRTSIFSLTRQSGGSTMFGSGVSSASLSFGSSITAYTGTAKTFSADEIERATDKFNESRILGEGGFGRVYKGILEDGNEVAVKVLKRDDQQGGREFLAEVEMLSRLHHRNLVKLIGICIEDHSRCLVYELIHNGSVESHLHGVDKETAPLDWGSRMKIALGAARGLAYLHEDSSPHVIHRDFKSSNILLERDFTPKVADFGLARTALDEGNKPISTRVMGTFGYVAPEYAMTGHLLVKSDVYSYGVVLLELLTGRKPVDMSQPEGQENLVAWARPLLTSKEGLEIIIDPTLGSDVPFESIAKVAAIASMCVQPEVSHRPFMGEVVQALKLVCNECDETKAGSESCSQEYTSVVDIDTRTSTGSGHLVGTSHVHSDYDSSPDANRGLSASEIFSTSRRYGRQSPGSFRRYSSSGPLRTGRRRQFWQRVRGLSRGSVSEHGFAYRLWRESS